MLKAALGCCLTAVSLLLPVGVNAQASVGLSGDLNVALASLRGRTDSGQRFSTAKLDSVASHLRVRGTEQLDGGMSAVMFLTIGVRADAGSGMVCSRECWIALKGAAGTLKLGRLLTLYDDVSLPWYYIDAGGSHNPAALWANCGRGAGATAGCLDDFVNKAIRYDTPELGGFSASVTLSSEERAREAGGHSARSLVTGVEYRRGKTYVGVALLKQQGVRAAGSSDSAVTLGVGLKGALDVGLGYEHVRYSIAGGGVVQRHYVGLMLKKVVGPHTTWMNLGIAGSGYGNARPGSLVNEVSNTPDSGARMDSLGYQYKFSRSAQIYTFLNTIRNQANGTYCFDNYATNLLGTGRRLSVFTVGMRKRF